MSAAVSHTLKDPPKEDAEEAPLEVAAALVPAPAHTPGDDEALTINEFAALRHVSPSTVVRRIREGVIPAERGPEGYRIRKTVSFEISNGSLKKSPPMKGPSERAADRAKLAASAFPLFRSGTPLDEIVIALVADPTSIRELFVEWSKLVQLSDQWLTPGGGGRTAGPKFDHEPNVDWSCCAAHKLQNQSKGK